MKIEYIKGDATDPAGTGNKIIVHVCNDIGGWGRGFVMALSSKWKEPEQQYRDWYVSKENFHLGEVSFVQVQDDIWIANLIGQRDIKPDKNGVSPVRYDAIEKGLGSVAGFAIENNASVHMPKIGCGLAGGKWELMEPIITNKLIGQKVQVTVYDL